MSDTQQRIDSLVKNSDIVLFMKGNASFPMCGFSGRAIQILKACGVDPKDRATVNVLEDDAIRQGIKEYSNWPTIPQLYVKGEFIGGSDIMMEMYENGELQQVLGGEPPDLRAGRKCCKAPTPGRFPPFQLARLMLEYIVIVPGVADGIPQSRSTVLFVPAAHCPGAQRVPPRRGGTQAGQAPGRAASVNTTTCAAPTNACWSAAPSASRSSPVACPTWRRCTTSCPTSPMRWTT
jgi:monothiol glutaredoxin